VGVLLLPYLVVGSWRWLRVGRFGAVLQRKAGGSRMSTCGKRRGARARHVGSYVNQPSRTSASPSTPVTLSAKNPAPSAHRLQLAGCDDDGAAKNPQLHEYCVSMATGGRPPARRALCFHRDHRSPAAAALLPLRSGKSRFALPGCGTLLCLNRSPASDLTMNPVVNRSDRDALVEVINEYLEEKISAFTLDERLSKIEARTDDPTVQWVRVQLWYCYDDARTTGSS